MGSICLARALGLKKAITRTAIRSCLNGFSRLYSFSLLGVWELFFGIFAPSRVTGLRVLFYGACWAGFGLEGLGFGIYLLGSGLVWSEGSNL